MPSTSQKQGKLFSRQSIKSALQAYRDTEKLAQHPLAKLKLVESQRQEDRLPNTPRGYGNALRAVFNRVIETLKPDDEEPEYPPKAWRPYIILNERYIDGHQVKDICQSLSIGTSTFDREHNKALKRLGDTLEKWEQKCDSPAKAFVPFMAPSLPSVAIIGRDQILADLRRRLFAGDNLALFALNGLPGVGKTALAIALAHDEQVRAHFSDGVLWVGLGHEPDVMTLLSIWGGAQGIPASEMAKYSKVEERAQVINAAIGTRRMLLVIDDAWKIEDALAFKLGGPNCAHILTTRLPDLAWDFARQGARAVQELNESDSLALLSQFVPQLVTKQPQQAGALVKAVDGLPLAVILMGRYLEKRIHLGTPDVLLDLLEELQVVKNRLELTMPQSVLEKQPNLPLNVPISLLASIEISDNALEEPARQVLRALSVFRPKPNTFSEEAALAAADESSEKFHQLTKAGLVESSGIKRYTMHQVIADYASHKNNDPDTPYRRAATYFAQFAQKHSKEGYKELDLDWQNIESAMQWASSNQQWAPLVEGVQGLTEANLGVVGFMDARGYWSNIRELLKEAHKGAQALNEPLQEATILTKMGAFAFRQADFKSAEAYLTDSLSMLRQLPASQEIILHRTHCYEFLARLEMQRELEAAHEWIEQGLTELEKLSSEAARYQTGYFNVLLSELNGRTGRFKEAIEAAQKGLALLPPLPTSARIVAFIVLGNICSLRGNIKKTIKYQKKGIEIAKELGDSRRLANLLMNLANEEGLRMSNFSVALINYQNALRLHQKMANIDGQSNLYYNIGLIYVMLGEDEFALNYLKTAIELAETHRLLRHEAFAKTHWANFQIYRGKFTEAADALIRAHEIVLQLELTSLLPVVLYWQAEMARLKGQHDKGLALINGSLQNAKRGGYFLEEGIAWSIKGKILDAMRCFNEAESAHQTSLQMLAERSPYDLAHSKLAFGEHYMMRDGELSQRAKSSLAEALVIFERLGSKREIALIKTLLAPPRPQMNLARLST